MPKKTGSGFRAVISTTPGDADVYTSGLERTKIWHVQWKRIDLSLTNQGPQMGKMTGVRATLLSGSAKGVVLTSGHGVGDPVKKILTLTENVVVTSSDGKAQLFCDSLKYDSGKQLFDADGNVKVQNQVGSIGTFSRLMATSDLHRIGTPKEFNLP